MGIIFGLVGAFIGAWCMSEDRDLFGFVTGMMIGWLLYRLRDAHKTIARQDDRLDALEKRDSATAETEGLLAKPVPAAAPNAESRAEDDTEAKVKVMPAAYTDHSQTVVQGTAVTESRPSMAAHTLAIAKRWLTTGNVPVKVGVLISFFGVAFLLKYAVEKNLFLIPMSVRYLLVAGFAAVLLTFGWRIRHSNRVFALSIQGGGIGVLFLIVFAAFRLHDLLPSTVAFGMLILITVTAGVLAIQQESRAFAILGTSGGFLAPLLVSTGEGNHVGLFSYYLILNGAILGIAWFRAWRELNIIGFGFTFVVGTIWGYQYYVPELFATTEPFLILYFLFYTIIAVLFAFRQSPKLRGYVDGTLIFGTPTIAFALQSQLLSDTQYALAISAAAVAAFYAMMALWLRRTQQKNFELLSQSFVVLAVAFATVAIPLALDHRWTAIAWAMEGAALVWIGVHQKTTLAKMTGAALAFASASEFLNYGWVDDLGVPVFNGNFLGGSIIALTSLFSSRLLASDRHGRDWQRFACVGLLMWGVAWWFGTGSAEIIDRVPSPNRLHALLLFGVSSLAVIAAAGRYFQWLAYRRVSLALLPALFVAMFIYLFEYEHFFKGLGVLGWLSAMGAHLWILHVNKGENSRVVAAPHLWGAVFFVALLSFEVRWQISRVIHNDVWSVSAGLLTIAAATFAFLLQQRRRNENRVWPFSTYSDAYSLATLLLVLTYVLLVTAVCLADPGDPRPAPYVPLLNPFDVLSVVAVLLLGYGMQLERQFGRWGFIQDRRTFKLLLGGTAFLLSTIAVVRILHHTLGVDWYSKALLNSVSVQSTLSIYWALLGVGGMVLGTRQKKRSIWVAGATLMAVVVLKLFVIDLGNTGTVARIISFLGVGVMLLFVGYFSPVPPKQADSATG